VRRHGYGSGSVKLGLLVLPELPPERLVATVRAAEELGYSHLWHADEKFYRDPWVGLTLAALNSRSIRLGTGVVEPYARHPALLAMAIASLDELSGGRAILGIGAGGTGFPPMGVERRRPAVAIREAVTLVRALLAGETVTLDGEVIHFRNGRLNFRARPDIPIVVAARGARVLEVAGEVGDGVMIAPYASEPGLRHAIGIVERGIARAKRRRSDVQVIARVDVCIAPDRAVARAAVKRMVALPLWVSYPNLGYLDPLPPVRLPPELDAILARRDYSLIPEAAALIPDELVQHLAVAGTPEDVLAQVRAIASTGVDQITVHPVAPPGGDTLAVARQFAEEVVPRL
jgi:5,10-methylenetetrahydromethanopterin reductase